jgi:hypothetical protein
MLIVLPFSPELSKNKRSFVKLARSKQGNLFGRITKTTQYSDEFETQIFLARNQIKNRYPDYKFNPESTYMVDVLNVVTDRRSDSHNLVDATMDILQEVTGVNDRNFQLVGWPSYHKERRKLSKIEKALELQNLKGKVFIEIVEAHEDIEKTLLEQFRGNLSERDKDIFDLSFDGI